jgi:hypothetical protein
MNSFNASGVSDLPAPDSFSDLSEAELERYQQRDYTEEEQEGIRRHLATTDHYDDTLDFEGEGKYDNSYEKELAERRRKIGRAVLHAVRYFVSPGYRKVEDARRTKAEEKWTEELAEHYAGPAEMELYSRRAEQERIREEAAKEAAEKTRQDEEFLAAAEAWRKKKTEGFQDQRKRELVERGFAGTATTVEDLAEAAEIGDARVEKQEVRYGDKEVTVYNLDGYPLEAFMHVIGVYTGTDVANNGQPPERWAEGMSENGGGSPLLSLTYVKTDKKHRVFNEYSKNVTYGFSHIRQNSVNWVGKHYSTKDTVDFYTPAEVGYDTVNEFNTKRYDEKGQPLLPDFVVTIDGNFEDQPATEEGRKRNKDSMAHAAYFGVPIVNIRTGKLEEIDKT